MITSPPPEAEVCEDRYLLLGFLYDADDRAAWDRI